MSKPLIGIGLGAALGLLDGLSAWLSPEARPMMTTIVIGSTVKGVITGLLAGLIARSWHSTTLGVISGVAIGGVLSTLAAMGQEGHYMEIILPGMLLGAFVGYVTQRFPRPSTATRVLALAFLVFALPVAAQQPPSTDRFAAVSSLLGKWAGTSEGQPGTGTVEREYERVLGSRFIRVRNRSTYPPQEKNPKGETHEDEGFISFDNARKHLVFRQFHVEGFVNTYAQQVDAKPGTVVFVTESIENIPSGYRARETYVWHSPDDMEEIFELAEPGKDYSVYSRTRLKRVK
jgi:hypothetical protein